MTLPRIYADFNALEGNDPSSGLAPMPLTGYGTLTSLARQGLRLTEGMELVLYEPDDIECKTTVHFDATRKDPADRDGEWVALVNRDLIRDCQVGAEDLSPHPCICCGHDFAATTDRWRDYKETCSNCGASVMEPMAPPKGAV